MSEHFLADHFGRRFNVPSLYPVIQIGSEVTWLVETKRKNGPKPFMATGRVVELHVTTFGGKLRKLGAKIDTSEDYQKVFPGRTRTLVTVNKLKLV